MRALWRGRRYEHLNRRLTVLLACACRTRHTALDRGVRGMTSAERRVHRRPTIDASFLHPGIRSV